jgi:hypothetical protein
MPSQREKILTDLLNIYLKYSADDIAAALGSLQSGEAFSQFVELGRKASGLPESHLEKSRNRRALPPRKHVVRSRRALLDEFIATLLSSENKQHQEIASVLRSAIDREILNSTSMLQKLFHTIGIPVDRHKDRLAMVHILGDHLLKLQPEEIASIIQLAKDTGKQESSLQRWTDIIVHKS